MPSEATGSESIAAVRESSVLSELWRYWRSKLQGRPMPLRAEIEPGEIAKLLPYLQLVEKVDRRYRYRLNGTAIADAYGYELTGKFLDEAIPVGRRAVAAHHYDLVCTTGRPLFARNLYATARGTEIVVSRLFLPLGMTGPEVAMLLLGHSFVYRSEFVDKLGEQAAIRPDFGLQEFLSAGASDGA